MSRPKKSTVPNYKPRKFVVTFTIVVDDEEDAAIVEEAMTSLVDEELLSHRNDGSTRCGVQFIDTENFHVVPVRL
jgi:hypothetical protein